MDNRTSYNALSVTKTFTALAILQLAEQNKLNIEQPVITYLPDFLYSLEITVQQLLTHTAGIPNPVPLSWIHLTTENLTIDKKPTGMGLAWFSGQLNGKKYFAHAGRGGGYYVEIRIYPDSGIGSLVFFNRTGMSDERFLDKVDKIYFENYPNK